METYGLISLLPPVVAIVLALWTRQVFLALLLGIASGFLILAGGNPFQGLLATLNGFVSVFESNYNTEIIIFTLLIGALIALIQRAGGVEGFVNRVLNWLQKKAVSADGKGQRKRVELLAVLTGALIFVESNISTLTVGTLYRPVTDKLGIPREKLAYIADSTCAPICILIPLNAWGAYIMAQLAQTGTIDQPLSVLVGAIAFNFYPILTIAILLWVILSGRDVGEMKTAEQRGTLLREGAVPMMAGEITMMEAKDGVKTRARNMIIPLLALVILMPVFLLYTGWTPPIDKPEASGFFDIVDRASGSKAVLYAVTGAIIVSMGLNKAQGLMGIREMVDVILKGMSGMLPLALLMVLAFALGDLCGKDGLGTGLYVAEQAKPFLSPALVPALIFLISAFIAFSTGTSWGTFAIMIAIAVPLAQGLDTNVNLAVAAALGGGVFGDHCSPTSDTSIITSMATANDHIDHVRTQLPYALIGGGITVVLYLILGVIGV